VIDRLPIGNEAIAAKQRKIRKIITRDDPPSLGCFVGHGRMDRVDRMDRMDRMDKMDSMDSWFDLQAFADGDKRAMILPFLTISTCPPSATQFITRPKSRRS